MIERNKEDYYSLTDIVISIKSFLGFLVRKWWILVMACLVGAGLGAVYYYMQKPKYEAVCTFILEEKQSGMGGLSSIASQFGLDVGGLNGGGSIFAGDNILDILKSRNIIQKVLLSKVDSSKIKENETLADLYLDFSGWKQKWSSNEDLKNISYSNYKPGMVLTLKQDSVLNLIYEYLLEKSLTTERLNKKGTIIKVVMTTGHQYFAKLMADRIIEESKDFYITIKTNTSQQNVSRLERKSDSLLALLNNKSYQAASAVVLDANPALKNLNVPSELKMRDKTVLGTLYAEIVKNLELSRISLSQQTPVIQILDRPHYPLVQKEKKLFSLLILFSLISLLIVISALGIKFIWRQSVQQPS